MICDVSNLDFMRQWWPCRLFDATGAAISGHVVWADTETGECAQFVEPDEKGRFDMTVDETGEMTISKHWATYPAPLRLERMRA